MYNYYELKMKKLLTIKNYIKLLLTNNFKINFFFNKNNFKYIEKKILLSIPS